MRSLACCKHWKKEAVSARLMCLVPLLVLWWVGFLRQVRYTCVW
jgi:hypothetical protein